MKHFLYRIFHFTYTLEQSRRRRLTTNGLIIFSCLIISAVLGLDTNQNMTYQIFTFLLSIFIISIISSRFFPFRFSAIRTLPRFATVGVNLKYRIIIHNKTNKIQNNLKLLESFADPRPTFQEFIETPEPFEKKRNPFDRYVGYYRWVWLIARKRVAAAKQIDLPSLPPNNKIEVVYEITPAYRGVIRFADLTVIRPDPFGLLNAYTTIYLPQSLLVLPQLYNLPSVKLPGTRRYQSGGVALASSVGDSEEFRSLREYRPGDSLRKIHWKSWAKIGKPIVKEEQDEFFVRHALILDTFQKEKYSEILEEAVAIAASLACEVQTQESLLDLMFVGHEAYCFTFGRGLSHTDKMLEILASVVACRDKSFDSLIPTVMERISLLSGCICIFLTWDETRKKLINYLKGVGIHTLVLILSDKENIDWEFRQDNLTSFHILKLGNIQEDLMRI